MIIRHLEYNDIKTIVDAFALSNWTIKESSLFEKYYEEQSRMQRVCLVAFKDNSFAGYVTVKWESNYPLFFKGKIPEIVDLNVLPNFRNKGIASTLLDKAEEIASSKSSTVGIGVGLYKDYGSAQRIYIKRGYIPDGQGVTYNFKPTTPGETYCLDDDFVLWFTKTLNT